MAAAGLAGSWLLRSGCVSLASGRSLSTSTAAASSASFDFRRLKKKQGWASPAAIAAEDDGDFLAYPRERLGNDYALNWAINEFKITPTGQAYRNLHLRGLMMLTKGAKDAQQAIHASSSAAVPESAFKQLSVNSDEFRSILRATRIYLTGAPDIFVHDGAIGSNPAEQHTVRVFADNAATALWCHHRIGRLPERGPRGFRPDFQVYVLADVKTEPFVAVDPEVGVVVLNGVSSTRTLEAALGVLLGHKQPDMLSDESFSVLVNGSVLRTASDVSLIVNDAKLALPAHPSLVSQLFSTSPTIWTNSGLSRAFDGYSLPLRAGAASRGALVDSEQITGSLRLPNVAEQPTRAIFVAAGKSGVSLAPAPLAAVAPAHGILHDVLKRLNIPTFQLSLAADSSAADVLRALGAVHEQPTAATSRVVEPEPASAPASAAAPAPAPAAARQADAEPAAARQADAKPKSEQQDARPSQKSGSKPASRGKK